MNIPSRASVLALAMLGLFLSRAAVGQNSELPPLPIEKTGKVESLPKHYPNDWFLVADASFFHMSDGKIYVMDVGEDTVPRQVKGFINNSLMGSIYQSAYRGEIYVAETFHSRGSRGDRLDVLTIWDPASLTPMGEVILPGAKRFIGMPQRDAMVGIDNDRWLAIANFSPATSITLIDLDSREIISEIPTPGCTLVYPTGKLGFSSLCADGRFMSTELASDGTLIKQTRTDAFFDSDTSPIFERPAIIGDMAYFPSFAGLVYPVDLGGPVAKVGKPWNLVPESERDENWGPGGIGITGEDDQGRFYVLMHPGAGDGTQNGGGSEVWVYDAAKRERVLRIPMKVWGLSLAVSHGDKPLLLITNPTDMSLELYDAGSGNFIKSITDFGQETPLMLFGSK